MPLMGIIGDADYTNLVDFGNEVKAVLWGHVRGFTGTDKLMFDHAVCLKCQDKLSVKSLLDRVVYELDESCSFAVCYPIHLAYTLE